MTKSTRVQTKEQEQPALDPVTQMLMDRLEAIELQNRLALNNLAEAMEAQTAEMRVLKKQAADAKNEAAQALQAIAEEREKWMNRPPPDPELVRAVARDAAKEAKSNIAHKRRAIAARIDNEPRGTIRSGNKEVQTLQIHGFTYKIQPGINLNVPGPFIELWETLCERQRQAEEHELGLRGIKSYGAVDNWLHAGRGASSSVLETGLTEAEIVSILEDDTDEQ